MPSWFDIQWPAAGGPFGRLALGSVVSGSYALESNANGVRLARLALSFGASEPDSDRREQNFNVGGAVARLDLAGWLNLNVAVKEAKPVAEFLRTARLEVSGLDYLGLGFRHVCLAFAAGA